MVPRRAAHPPAAQAAQLECAACRSVRRRHTAFQHCAEFNPNIAPLGRPTRNQMALTRGKASAGGAGGPKAGKVRKVKAKAKPGAVVTKRLVVRRSGSSKGPASQPIKGRAGQRAAAEQQGQPDHEEQEEQAVEEEQREQQPAPGAKRLCGAAAVAAAAGGRGQADATIDALSAEALQEVFLHIGQEQQSYCRCGRGGPAAVHPAKPHTRRRSGGCSHAVPQCPIPLCRREILPLVCQRFRDVLLEPSCVWEVSTELPGLPKCTDPAPTSCGSTPPAGDSRPASAPAMPSCAIPLLALTPPPQNLHIDFLQKGLDLAFSELQQPGDGDGLAPPDGSNRRLLHSAVERWLKPRAAAVKRLVLS